MVERTASKPFKWNGRYAVYLIEGSKEKRKTREKILGLCSEMTKADAEEKLRQIIRQENGAAPWSEMTLWEFLHHPTTGYIALRSPNWTPAWKETVDGLFEKHFKDSIAALKLSEINRANCQAWLNKIGTKGFSQSLIHNARRSSPQFCARRAFRSLSKGTSSRWPESATS